MNQINVNEELKLAFRVFDKDSNGNIPTDELRNIFQSIDGTTEEEIKELIEICDSDGNGGIDFDGIRLNFLTLIIYMINFKLKFYFKEFIELMSG